MYKYDNLWIIMKRRGITKYALRTHYGITKNTLDRLKANKNVEIQTLDKFCSILDCNFGDIVEYYPDDASEIYKIDSLYAAKTARKFKKQSSVSTEAQEHDTSSSEQTNKSH